MFSTKSLAIVLSLLMVLIFLLNKFIFVFPYEVNMVPNISSDNSFYAEIEIECNNVLKREIGFTIEPPINIADRSDTKYIVSGDVKLFIKQGNKKKEFFIKLLNTGTYVNSKGIWLKIIKRFDPLGSFFCNEQKIVVEANNLNFSLADHVVKLYVSRDRRL